MVKRSEKWHQELKEQVLEDPVSRAEYEAFKLQLELADQLKSKRKKAHFTQEMVADIMETRKPVVARLEAAGGKGKHSPSLKTLAKYAYAVNCQLKIRLVPMKKIQEG